MTAHVLPRLLSYRLPPRLGGLSNPVFGRSRSNPFDPGLEKRFRSQLKRRWSRKGRARDTTPERKSFAVPKRPKMEPSSMG